MQGLLLSLVLLADPRAKTVDVFSGGVVQVQGGRAPLSPGEAPVPSIASTITPMVRLAVRDRVRSGAFSLGYAPRVLVRWPNIAGIRRPLLLHQFDTAYGARMTSRWDFAGRASASVGELDYTAARLVFGDGQGALPQTELVQYLQTRAGMTFSGRLTRRHQFGVSVDGGYGTPLGTQTSTSDDPAMLVPSLPRSTSTSLAVLLGYRLTARDTLTTSLGGTFVDFDTRGSQTTQSLQTRWDRQLTRRLGSRVGGGVYSVQVLRRPTTGLTPTDTAPVLPTANAGLDGRLVERARFRLSADVSASSQAYLDQITGEVLPQAGGTFGLTAYFPPRWTAAATASFYTLATLQPRDFGGTPIDPNTSNETVVNARTPVSYRVDERLAFEFGTIVSARAPHVRTPGFAFRQLETWLYFAVRFQVTTAHTGGQRAGGGGSTISGGSVQ
jgi:hypothetical protein